MEKGFGFWRGVAMGDLALAGQQRREAMTAPYESVRALLVMLARQKIDAARRCTARDRNMGRRLP